MVLRQLCQLSESQVRGQCEATVMQNYGQIQPKENLDGFHIERILFEYQKSSVLWILYAGNRINPYGLR